MMELTPGIKSLKRELQLVIEDLLRDDPYLNDKERPIEVMSEYTRYRKSNRAIYLGIKSVNKEAMGLSSYAGIKKDYYMLIPGPKSECPSISIRWVQLLDSLFNIEDHHGTYFITIGDGVFSYLRVVPKEATLTSNYNKLTEGPTFTIPGTPVDPETVFISGNDYYLDRDSEFSVSGNSVTLIANIPNSVNIKVEWQEQVEVVENIPFEKDRVSNLLPCMLVYFNEECFEGDQYVLVINKEVRPAFHVYAARSNFSVTLSLSLGDKKEEERVVDYLYNKVETNMRSIFNRNGWNITDLAYSDEDQEEWDEGSYLMVSNASITFTIQMEWSKLIPMTEEFNSFKVSNTLGV